MNPIELNALIKNRRAVFPMAYNEKEIPKGIIEQIVENAHWAPTHKRTEPWRLKILRGPARQKLADFMVEDYKKNTPVEAQSDIKLKKQAENPLRSNCVIAICMKRSESLPEWEEVAAVAMAVQNMWLSCAAYGIGAYWSSPGAIGRMNDFLNLDTDEKCLGLFYMGYSDLALVEGRRTSLDDKVVWIE